ncbi:uncharacterized protein LOC115419100 [Sphaeramia orbicularis]|uniref:uncharacterized protein LOC115419100 n=1 Tax=Sphaeramia orbicularis TaxID=375764 RepID=UPI001180E31B|nr:uncharacterized protein LOC115419100 [Sphaeramia orbicularis]
MKTLFIAVVVLSFTSVCWSAPLACNNLLKEVDKGPDLGGRWYIIAVSSDSCLVSSLMKFLHPSGVVDFTQEEAPNIYDMVATVKMYGFCKNESQTLLHDNNRLMSYDKSTQQTTVTDSLLQTSCPDCVIGKTLNSMNVLFLFSRRQNVNDDELNEFVKQAECLKYKRPVVLNTDHDYENCKPVEEANEDLDPAVQALLTQRMEDFREAVINCIKNYFMSLYQSIANVWS